MAASYFFHYVTVVVGTTNPHILQAVRSNMWHIGCRDIAYARTPEDLEALISERKPDILLCDIDFIPDNGVARLFRRIRHGDLGPNPFLPIIGMVSHALPNAIRAMADSGADDVIPYPWKAGYLDERILRIINHRRPFVVTADYVGPDRRRATRPGTIQPPTLDVPNSLRARAMERVPVEQLAEQIRDGALTVTISKIQRLAELAQRLVTELSGLQKRTGVTGDILTACLAKLQEAVRGIHRRAGSTRYSGAIETCRVMERTIKVMSSSLAQGIQPELILLAPLTHRLGQECGLTLPVSNAMPPHAYPSQADDDCAMPMLRAAE